MKVFLELDVNEDDLFLTNQGIIPFKDITDGYLNIGKYQFRIRKDEINCYTCQYLSPYVDGVRFCRCSDYEKSCPHGFYWDTMNDKPVRKGE